MLRLGVRVWLKGLVAAFVGAAASGVAVTIADPAHFNITPEGLAAVGKVALVMGVFNAAMYLKQSPIPPSELPPGSAGPR